MLEVNRHHCDLSAPEIQNVGGTPEGYAKARL